MRERYRVFMCVYERDRQTDRHREEMRFYLKIIYVLKSFFFCFGKMKW